MSFTLQRDTDQFSIYLVCQQQYAPVLVFNNNGHI